jgi:hypothetical protein
MINIKGFRNFYLIHSVAAPARAIPGLSNSARFWPGHVQDKTAKKNPDIV